MKIHAHILKFINLTIIYHFKTNLKFVLFFILSAIYITCFYFILHQFNFLIFVVKLTIKYDYFMQIDTELFFVRISAISFQKIKIKNKIQFHFY